MKPTYFSKVSSLPRYDFSVISIFISTLSKVYNYIYTYKKTQIVASAEWEPKMEAVNVQGLLFNFISAKTTQ